jgi:hypothetical protein
MFEELDMAQKYSQGEIDIDIGRVFSRYSCKDSTKGFPGLWQRLLIDTSRLKTSNAPNFHALTRPIYHPTMLSRCELNAIGFPV